MRLLQLRLCAHTEAVKAACNGQLVPGRQLECYQLVNPSTDFYEIRHRGRTMSIFFILYRFSITHLKETQNCFRISKKEPVIMQRTVTQRKS